MAMVQAIKIDKQMQIYQETRDEISTLLLKEKI